MPGMALTATALLKVSSDRRSEVLFTVALPVCVGVFVYLSTW